MVASAGSLAPAHPRGIRLATHECQSMPVNASQCHEPPDDAETTLAQFPLTGLVCGTMNSEEGMSGITAREPCQTVDLRRDTAALGDYFALDEAVGCDWREWAEFLDDDVLIDFVRRTRTAIAAAAGCAMERIPPRMAASSFHLNVSARLLSPVIGSSVCQSAVPLLTARSVRWAATNHHCPRFADHRMDYMHTGELGATASAICDSVMVDVLAPFGQALRNATGLSDKIIRGNVISSANGAVTVLSMSRPEHSQRGRDLIRHLLESEYLSDTGYFNEQALVRRSCCLFYTGPHPGLCGDCVLAAR